MSWRRAELRDIDRVLELQRSFYEHEGYPYHAADAAAAVRQLASDETLGRLLVAERDGEVVAYVSITFGFSLEFGGRNAFVDELFVAGSARGLGLGTEAISAAEAACREAGVRSMHLEVEFENAGARRLYQRLGFYEHSRFLMTRRLVEPSV